MHNSVFDRNTSASVEKADSNVTMFMFCTGHRVTYPYLLLLHLKPIELRVALCMGAVVQSTSL